MGALFFALAMACWLAAGTHAQAEKLKIKVPKVRLDFAIALTPEQVAEVFGELPPASVKLSRERVIAAILAEFDAEKVTFASDEPEAVAEALFADVIAPALGEERLHLQQKLNPAETSDGRGWAGELADLRAMIVRTSRIVRSGLSLHCDFFYEADKFAEGRLQLAKFSSRVGLGGNFNAPFCNHLSLVLKPFESNHNNVILDYQTKLEYEYYLKHGFEEISRDEEGPKLVIRLQPFVELSVTRRVGEDPEKPPGNELPAKLFDLEGPRETTQVRRFYHPAIHELTVEAKPPRAAPPTHPPMNVITLLCFAPTFASLAAIAKPVVELERVYPRVEVPFVIETEGEQWEALLDQVPPVSIRLEEARAVETILETFRRNEVTFAEADTIDVAIQIFRDVIKIPIQRRVTKFNDSMVSIASNERVTAGYLAFAGLTETMVSNSGLLGVLNFQAQYAYPDDAFENGSWSFPWNSNLIGETRNEREYRAAIDETFTVDLAEYGGTKARGKNELEFKVTARGVIGLEKRYHEGSRKAESDGATAVVRFRPYAIISVSMNVSADGDWFAVEGKQHFFESQRTEHPAVLEVTVKAEPKRPSAANEEG